MKRKMTPLHNRWHRIVEGQIRDCVQAHPKWFNFKDDTDKKTCVNSLAKRIVGEIVAGSTLATVHDDSVREIVEHHD